MHTSKLSRKNQRMPLRLAFVWLVLGGGLTGGVPAARPAPQDAGGVTASKPKFHLLRTVSGPKGSVVNGQFLMEGPRSIFYVPADREVVVYFEWQGPLGQHHLQALWKSPDNKTTSLSDLDYVAKENRFGAYWKLVLTEDSPTGIWSVEARVDGEVAGVYTFEIVSGTSAPSAPKAAPPPPTPAQIYAKAKAASVFVEALDAQGGSLGRGSGFFIAEGAVLTAFQNIEGASKLRLTLADGVQTETDAMAAWSRWQDWAVLKTAVSSKTILALGHDESESVGDRCYYVDATAELTRSIVETVLAGKNTFSRAGDRWSIGSRPNEMAIGSALLNEQGDVIGILGGSLLPGARTAQTISYSGLTSISGTIAGQQEILVVPIDSLPADALNKSGTTLAELVQKGELTPALVDFPDLILGEMGRQLLENQRIPSITDLTNSFKRSDADAVLQVVWRPKNRWKGMVSLQIYDIDNHLVGQPEPKKADLRPGESTFSTWHIGIAKLQEGVYRIDLMRDQAPYWRTYFRISE
jgi:hypothetical protein